MCLNTVLYNSRKEALEAKKKPLVAKKDIPVYKVLTITNEPPYYCRFKYKQGFRYTEKKLGIVVEVHGQYYKLIGKRGLHACLNKKAAAAHTQYSDKIVKMYIPKGAKYYKGIDDDVITTDLVWY